MLISETRIRSLVKKALLEAASQEDIDKKAAEIKEKNPGLTDAQAKMLAKDAIENPPEAEEEEAAEQIPEKGFGEWDKVGGDAFRQWVNDEHPEIARSKQLDPPSNKSSHTNSYIKKVYN